MPLSLSPGDFFSRSISNASLQKLIASESRAQATEMDVIERFKDLPYSNKKGKFVNDLYSFIYSPDSLPEADFNSLRKSIRDAPLYELQDFFSAKNKFGMPLLHVALKTGQANVIARYRIFLELLPEELRGTFLNDLLVAADSDGNSGLSWALEEGHTDAIVAYKSLLELLSPQQRASYLAGLLCAKDQNGNPGLMLALCYGRADAIFAYKELLKLLTPEQRSECLVGLLAAKDKNGVPGLAWALQNGHAGAITAYKELLELLAPEQRAEHLEDLLIAKDRNGIPGLVGAIGEEDVEAALTAYKELLEWIADKKAHRRLVDLISVIDIARNQSLQRAFETDDANIITVHRLLLDIVPEDQQGTLLADLLLAKNSNGTSGLSIAMTNGHAAAIAAYKELLKRIPEAQRAAHLVKLLAAVDARGKHCLFYALRNGHADAITAYKELLELLSPAQRAEHLVGLVTAMSRDGNPGLYLALQNGHADAITAYKGLLELLSPAQREQHLVGILEARSSAGIPGLWIALVEGHGHAITAYKACLELLTEQQRREHLGDLLAAKGQRDYGPALFRGLIAGHTSAVAAYEGLQELIPDGSHADIFRKIFPKSIFNSWIRFHQDEFSDHLGNRSHRSLLTWINNIDDRHKDLKQQMMVELAGYVRSLDISASPFHRIVGLVIDQSANMITASSAQSMIDIWMNNPLYATHPVIFDVIKTILVPVLIATGNTGKLQAGEKELTVLIKAVQETVQSETGGRFGTKKGTFMLENNGFFVQLMALATNHPDPATKKAAEDLYDQYLNLDELRQHKAKLAELGYDHGIKGTGSPDQLDPISSSDFPYLFVHRKNNSQTYDGLILSQDQISAMLSTDQICDWSKSAFVTETVSPDGEKNIDFVKIGVFKPSEIFPQFALFRTSFQFQSTQGGLHRLLTRLNLKYANESNEVGVQTIDYTPDFIKAFSARTSRTKLTAPDHQNTLRKIFGRFLTEPTKETWTMQSLPTLTDAHVQEILQNYRPSTSPANSLVDARILFCLAAVFAKLSSSSYFGEEFDSPVPIRVYAAGLLKKARELNQHVCSKSQYDTYMQKLLGLNGAFTCTGMLSTDMMAHAGAQADFNKILMRVRPVSWT